jgi:hypothetical protein
MAARKKVTLEAAAQKKLEAEMEEAAASYLNAKQGLEMHGKSACHFEGCTCKGFDPAILPPHNCTRKGCGHGAVFHYG